MSWGFLLHQKERAPRRVTNVRDDKILESRFWRAALSRSGAASCRPRRSVSPAAMSSLLRGTGLLCAVAMTDRFSPSLAFGGVTRARSRKTDRRSISRSMRSWTTTPNKLVATINHERMPVLLTREEEFDVWLNGALHVASGSGVPARADADRTGGLQESRPHRDRKSVV